MTPESHIQSLEEEIGKKRAEIEAKEKQMALLKEGITTDKAVLKIYEKGLDKMKAK
jgi:5'-3' exonuclease